MEVSDYPTRRRVLAVAGAGATLALLVPRLAAADPSAVTEAIRKIAGDRKMVEGRIKFDVPQIAENGNTVPLTVAVDSPMSADDYVKSVHVWADGNPLPGVVSFHFTSASGKAQASTRMRLARTQNIHAVAETSKGELYTAKTEIKVTIGGCGG
jgi:sulfur-oxidizing protein SoxY